LNYIGQGSYLLAHHSGLTITEAVREQLHLNSFYDLMPGWFVIVGIIVATSAAIIASQAMIAGSFYAYRRSITFELMAKNEGELSL
jgi:KUP system potassium uptake protein